MRVELIQDKERPGRSVARKRAESADEATRLRREADLLDVATHPGLAQPLAFDDGELPVLTTAAIARPLPPADDPLAVEEIAGVVAVVATTLADLHALGLVHGAVAPDHILLDDDGRPVMCSLGYGGVAGEHPLMLPALDASLVDPARATGAALDPAFDVYAAGGLIDALLATYDAGNRSAAADALRRVAAQARAGESRLTSRQVADAVHDTVPAARLPRRHDAPAPPPAGDDVLAARRRQQPLEHWRNMRASESRAAVGSGCHDPRRVGRVGVAVAAALVMATIAVSAAARRGGDRTATAPTLAAVPPTSAAVPPSSAPEPSSSRVPVAGEAAPTSRPPAPRPTNRPGCAPVEGPLSADVDGDGCPDGVRFSAGVVEAAGLRWAVGTAGDVATVGDWTCSGDRSLAVLRPQTGQVFAFDGWATAGSDAHASLVGSVAGGESLRPADIDGDGCNELVVERRGGPPAVLTVPRGRS